jgi:hypothetical protein
LNVGSVISKAVSTKITITSTENVKMAIFN